MSKRVHRKKPTLSEVAKAAGVSVSAASKALLNGGGATTKVSATTAERIRSAAERIGYRPNSAARQLKTGRSGIVGAIIHTTAPHIYYDRFARIQRKLAERGFCFMIGQSDGDVRLVERYLNEFHSRNADVILTAYFDHPDKNDFLQSAYAKSDNVLYMGEPESGDRPHVAIDTKNGIVQIVDHLVTRGIRRIALDVVDPLPKTIQRRMEGYRSGLSGNGLTVDERLMVVNQGPQDSIEDVVDVALEMKARAIIASNDLRALAVIRELRNRGVKVPQDMKVTGFDDLDFAKLCSPSLTTIDVRSDAVADATIGVIMNYVKSHEFSESVMIKPKLVVRESA